MADITGTQNNDTLQGTPEDDLISGLNGQDTMSGEGGDDSILGGGGDDVLFGDAGEGTAPGTNAAPLNLSVANARDETYTGNNAQAGDSVIYDNVTTLEDGTPVSARLILVSKTDPDMPVDLAGRPGAEILLNGEPRTANRVDAGNEATFRMEFFDPATGEPVSINSTATFADLDRNGPGDNESVTLDADSFSAFGTSGDTSLEVTNAPGSVTATGSEQNNPDDQDAWFSAEFEDRSFIEFTLETRSTQSGFTMNGDLIDDPVVEPIEPGNDTIDGGSGQDVIFGQGGDDSLLGGDGDDDVFGGSDNDNIDGGQGQDELFGGSGDDTITGGTGDDSLFGGEGEDTLIAGPDNDQLFGGEGSDTITIEGAGNHVIVGGEDPDGSDIDTLDLLAGNGTAYFGFNVIQDPDDPEAGLVELLDENGNVSRRVEYSEIENLVICFTPGTMIATPSGERAVETLREGDKVFTRDNGIQEIRWAGRRDLGPREMTATPSFQPVLVKAGALGNGLPERDLLLSPNHRVLMTGERSSLYFEETEVLSAAKHLTDMEGIDAVATGSVSYIHLLFDRHEVILSNGAWTETFQPGDYSMRGVLDDQRNEIVKLFPELELVTADTGWTSARKVLKKHEAKLLTR